MIIAHNMNALNALRHSINTNNKLMKSSEKLSTGYKINRASDNAAGLQISEKMRAQIRGLNQASTNAQDGISFVQTADGALNEMQSLIQRGRELCVQAANDTNVNEDRTSIQEEINAITNEINRITEQTEFNTIRCFPAGATAPSISSISSVQNIANYKITLDRSSDTVLITGSASGTNSVLTDKLASELIPNAVNQILNAFPSLDTNEKNIDLTLEVSNIDGPSGKLAYAQISYYPTTGDILSYTLKVDTSDFTDADAEGTGSNAEMLESTIAHEMMHQIMYNTLTDGMTDYGPETFPQWFVEGTAQVAGGGFTTGWNNTLTSIEKSAADSLTKDANVKTYLQTYTPNSRPYGHGYLATAYLGHLASGSSTVSASSISSGLDKVFRSMVADGKTLDQAIAQHTTFSNASAVESAFTSPSADLISFVRNLAAADGAGSAIAASLSTKGTDILNNSTGLVTMFTVTNTPTTTPGVTPPQVILNGLNLQIGANSGQTIGLELYDLSAEKLGIDSILVTDNVSAGNGIESYDTALNRVSKVRSYYGAIQNRLEHSIANADNTAENLQAAESRIRDVDMAKEMTNYSKYNILLQAGQAMMAQANQSSQGVLALLQ